MVARIVGTRLSDALGQPVVIDNRPAAAGSAIEKLLIVQDVKDRFRALGAEILFMTPEWFAQYVRAEIKKWSVVVKETGMRAE